MPDSTIERWARRAAERQGLRLEKSRRRDPNAIEYGTYQLTDRRTGVVVAKGYPDGYGLTIEEVERELLAGRRSR